MNRMNEMILKDEGKLRVQGTAREQSEKQEQPWNAGYDRMEEQSQMIGDNLDKKIRKVVNYDL